MQLRWRSAHSLDLKLNFHRCSVNFDVDHRLLGKRVSVVLPVFWTTTYVKWSRWRPIRRRIKDDGPIRRRNKLMRSISIIKHVNFSNIWTDLILFTDLKSVRGRLVWDSCKLDGLEIVIRVNYNDRWSFGETRSLERFETEISPIHRSTTTVHYRVFRDGLASFHRSRRRA